jgi:hypothetical protein
MKIILGTKFTAKKDGKEYLVVERHEDANGVKITFVDASNAVYNGMDEKAILSKLDNGDLINHKLLNFGYNDCDIQFTVNSTHYAFKDKKFR